jgi:hypothetical protein
MPRAGNQGEAQAADSSFVRPGNSGVATETDLETMRRIVGVTDNTALEWAIKRARRVKL